MIIEALLISFLMMIAAGFSSITGFGTSTISIPILLFFFSLPQTLLFVGIMRLIATVWKLVLFRGQFIWRLIFIIGVPAVLASTIGARAMLLYSQFVSKRLLGIFLISYVIFILLRPHFKLPQNSYVAVGGGALTGFSAGMFGISGPIQSAFLSAFDLAKVTFIFTTAVLDCLVDISRLTTYLVVGKIELIPTLLLGLVFSIPAIYLGAWLARRILYGIPQFYFRYVLLAFLAVVGCHWLLWG